MAGYLGQKPAVNGIYTVDEFTSSGGTTYTLSRAPGTKNNIQVNAGGLAQYPSAYSVSGTTLTLSGVPSGQKVVVRHMGETILYPNLDDGIVTSAKIATDAVTTGKIAAGAVGTTDIADDAVSLAKMADDAVGVAQLSATGTASSSNFLRGDNSWQAAGGGKVLQCIQNHVITQSSQTIPSGGSGGAAGYTNITNLNKTITPTESNSNILISIRYTGEVDHGSPADTLFGINRDSTAIGNPATSGSHPVGIAAWLITGVTAGTTQFSTSYSYMDTTRSAGTSAITYHATVRFQHGCPLYNNRTKNNTDDVWNEFMTSTIILWEISA